MNKAGIYRIFHIDSGKSYIGSTLNFRTRLSHHKWRLRKEVHTNAHLQRAWTVYGEDAFSIEILEVISDRSNLATREEFWIGHFKATDDRFGYNIRLDVVHPRHAEESKAKIRAFWTEDRRVEHAKKYVGRSNSMSSRRKQSETMKANYAAGRVPPMKGRVHSPEAVAKIVAAGTGRRHSAESREKMKASWIQRRAKSSDQPNG